MRPDPVPRCPRCSKETQPQDKFCSACGAQLAPPSASKNLKPRLAGWIAAAIAVGTAGVLVVVMVLLNLSRRESEVKLRACVKNNMHVVQTALEAYAVDHYGNYPTQDVSWEAGDETGMCLYFPGGDPIDQKPGNFPVNPYTGERYRYGKDLFYFPYYVSEPGICARKRSSDEYCPYSTLAAPKGVPGTIVVICYTPPWEAATPVEYGIAGFDRNTAEPMYDYDPASSARNGKPERIYFILNN